MVESSWIECVCDSLFFKLVIHRHKHALLSGAEVMPRTNKSLSLRELNWLMFAD